MRKILFISACVRDSSRTLILARDLLSKLSGEVPTEVSTEVTGDVVTEMSEKTKGEVTELRLEEEKIEPLSKDSLEKRDRLLAAGKTEDDFFCYARQFAQADCIVIAAPYWDLAFPALLKSYLEAVTVSGITFCYENNRPKGLCRAKLLYYVTTSGGPILSDFGYPYVEALAKNLYGIRETTCIRAENLDMDGADVEKILENAKAGILKQ